MLRAKGKSQESGTGVALIVESATPAEMTRIAQMLAEAAPWVMPVFAASPEQAGALETALAQRDGLVVRRVRTADELTALLETLRPAGASRRPSSWLSGLLRLSLAISSIQDQDSLMEELLGQAAALTGAVHGCVWLVDDSDIRT